MDNFSRSLSRLSLLVAVLPVIFVVVGFSLVLVQDGQSSGFSNVVRFFLLPGSCLAFGLIYGARFSDRFELNLTERRLLVTLFAAFVCYCFVLLCLKGLKYWNAQYDFYDAGLYVNKLWRVGNLQLSDALSVALGEGHFQPVLILYAELSRLLGGPFAAFALETLVLGSGVLPLSLLCRSKGLTLPLTCVVGLSYLLSPLVAFNDILGFHPDHVVLPLLLWAFYFSERQMPWRTLGCLLGICLASEPWMPMVAMFGMYEVLRHRRYVFGLGVFSAVTLMFFIALVYLIPSYGTLSNADHLVSTDSPYAVALYGDLAEKLRLLIDPRKFVFVYVLLAPFLLLPVLAPAVLVVALPELLKTLGSSEMLHYALEGHYTLGLVAVFFVGFVDGLVVVSRRWAGAAAFRLGFAGLCVTVGLSVAHSPMPWSFNFWSEWSGGAFNYRHYLWSERTQSLRYISSLIEVAPDTNIEITNGAFAPEFAALNRRLLIFPGERWKEAGFVLIDRDKYKGAGADSAQDRYIHTFNKASGALPHYFELVYEDEFFELWRHQAP